MVEDQHRGLYAFSRDMFIDWSCACLAIFKGMSCWKVVRLCLNVEFRSYDVASCYCINIQTSWITFWEKKKDHKPSRILKYCLKIMVRKIIINFFKILGSMVCFIGNQEKTPFLLKKIHNYQKELLVQKS